MAAPHNKGHTRGNKPTAFFGVEGVIITSLRTSTCCLVSDCKFEFARFIYAKDKTWVNVFHYVCAVLAVVIRKRMGDVAKDGIAKILKKF